MLLYKGYIFETLRQRILAIFEEDTERLMLIRRDVIESLEFLEILQRRETIDEEGLGYTQRIYEVDSKLRKYEAEATLKIIVEINDHLAAPHFQP